MHPKYLPYSFLTFLLFYNFITLANSNLSWFLSKEETSHKWAIIPSYKRTNSLGHEAIARIFIYPVDKTGLYISSSLHARFKNKYNLSYKSNLFYWSDQKSELAIKLKYDSTFDFKYKKNSTDQIHIPVVYFISDNHYTTSIQDHLSMGGLFEIRHRRELKKPCFFVSNQNSHLLDECLGFSEKEWGIATGWITRYDSRDNLFNPSKGLFIQTYIKVGYDLENSGPLFLQLEAISQSIFSLTGREKWVFSASGGWSLFRPSKTSPHIPYVYQFKLGGADRLRGYHQARWYSDQYYLLQAELRFSATPWLQLIAFSDAGNISFNKPPYFSIGSGIRLGIPPSYDQRIRIEFGIGKDQKNFIVAFSNPY